MANDGQQGPAEETARNAALRYLERGWSVIPVPHRSKNPGFMGWEQLRLTHETLVERFNGRPQNVGVLLGQPSGWLIDVDLEHLRAVEFAPQFLPPTPATFGRSSKPRSHWLYRVTGSLATKKFRSKSAGMIVEVRSTGTQTVFPPSTHESGEAIGWDDEGQEPADVDPELLMQSAKRLADAVLVELGEKQPARERTKLPAPQRRAEQSVSQGPISLEDRSARCLAAMLRLKISDQHDGSHRLFVCACRAVEHDLHDVAAITLIRKYAGQRRFRGHGPTTESCSASATPKSVAGAARRWKWTLMVAFRWEAANRSRASSCSRRLERCRRPRPMCGNTTFTPAVARCTATPAC